MHHFGEENDALLGVPTRAIYDTDVRDAALLANSVFHLDAFAPELLLCIPSLHSFFSPPGQ